MGAGFPVRPSRNAFGPTMANAGDQVRTDTDVDASQVNLTFWQAAGLGVVASMAWAVVSSAGARVASGESWNPNGDALLQPAFAKTGTGVYTVTYETLYPDEDGQDKALQLIGAIPGVQGSTANIVAVAGVALVSGQWVVTVKTTTAHTNAAVDAAFVVQVF